MSTRPGLLGERAYQRLKAMILSNELKPGQRLIDRDLARQLGVSRTPVVQALGRLEHEGLVTNRLRRGHFVADMDAKQVADLYDLRTMLEVHAVRLAIEQGTPSELEELEVVLTTLDRYRKDPARRSDEIKLGLRVHDLIARASGNPFLHDTLRRLLNRMWPFIWFETVLEDQEAADATHREHRLLHAYIRERRQDDAEALVRRHIAEAKDHMVKILKAREDFYQTPGVDELAIGEPLFGAADGASGSGPRSRPRARDARGTGRRARRRRSTV